MTFPNNNLRISIVVSIYRKYESIPSKTSPILQPLFPFESLVSIWLRWLLKQLNGMLERGKVGLHTSTISECGRHAPITSTSVFSGKRCLRAACSVVKIAEWVRWEKEELMWWLCAELHVMSKLNTQSIQPNTNEFPSLPPTYPLHPQCSSLTSLPHIDPWVCCTSNG